MQSSEFRGKALGGDVWVGFRPSAVRWGDPGVTLGGCVCAGPRLSAAGGSLRGWRIRPGTSMGSPGPKWAGGTLAVLPSNSLLSQGSPLSLIP